MSDSWIAVIPADPFFVPEEERWNPARERFDELCRGADEIEIKVSEHLHFFDCGSNLERIVCPSCKCEVPRSWWEDRMEEDYTAPGFRLAPYEMPCCQTACTLDELTYDWPQGFARFGIDAMNPNIGELEQSHRKVLEEILGTELRVIHQHI